MRKLRFTEIQWVAQAFTANHGRCGSSSAPKYPGFIPLCHAGLWVHTQHCGHTEDTQEKKKKSTNWNFSFLGLENSFSLGSECAQMPESRGAFQTACTLCRLLSVTGHFWISSEAVSAKKQKWQQWDLTSKDRWPQVDMGLCLTGCHTEYYITREWGCCHAFGKPRLAVFLTHYAVMNC